MHIDFPPRNDIMDSMWDMGQMTVHDWRTGVTIPVEQAEDRVLHAVYADKLRAKRAEERKKERFLTTDDW